MGSLYATFVLWPGLSAAVTGFLTDDWRLAGAVAALALALTVALIWLQIPFGTFALPFTVGITAGSAGLAIYLKLRRDTTVWDRMLVAMAAASAVGFALLIGLARAETPVG